MLVRRSALLAATTVAAAAVAIACAAPLPPSDLGGDDDDLSTPAPAPPRRDSGTTAPSAPSSSSTPPSTPAPSGDASTPTPTPTPSDTACAASGDVNTCYSCCIDKGKAAYESAVAVFKACVCQATGSCKAVCGDTYCSGKSATNACATCLATDKDNCFDKADVACQANAQCKVVDACMNDVCAPLESP